LLKILLSLKEKKMLPSLERAVRGHEVDTCRIEVLLESLKKKTYDLVISDGDVQSPEVIRRIDPRIEVILLGRKKEEAVDAVKTGASAYFLVPPDSRRVGQTVQDIDELFKKKRETAELEKRLNSKYTFFGVVGKNPKMLGIFNFLRRIAPYYQAITLTGETGTGKEIIAKTLHSLSPVNTGPFVACNCGGLVGSLIESELFGHKKGSFTGAVSDRKGLFEAASGGTIFLDEIGDLPLSFQSHLLRVLQDGEYRPVGSTSPLRANCRVIAATNKNLLKAVQNGTFRDDLFYRLTPLTIDIPPLRERKDDIPLLCRHFLDAFVKRTGKQVNGLSMTVQSALMYYSWPGNVRELQSAVEQAAIVTHGSFVKLTDLPDGLQSSHESSPVDTNTLDAAIKDHLQRVLAHCKGNRTRAAEILGLSRRALQRKLVRYAIK
jgi:DNA-binding NtrC family response regulator